MGKKDMVIVMAFFLLACLAFH